MSRSQLSLLALTLSLWSALPPPAQAEDDLFGDPFGDESPKERSSADEDQEAEDRGEVTRKGRSSTKRAAPAIAEDQEEEQEEDAQEEGDGDDGGGIFDPDAEAPEANANTSAEDGDDDPTTETVAPGLRVKVALGGGVGMRGLRRPTRNSGSQVLPDQAFPVADLGLWAELWPEQRFGLALQLRLQTSVFGFRIKDFQPLADGTVVDARSDRLELVAVPSYGLGADGRALRVAVAVGGTLRSLWHGRHELNVPRYSFIGVVARPQLILPIGPWYAQAGPELQYFLLMDEALIKQGAQGTALGVGVELTIGWTLAEGLALEATYRESYTRGSGNPVDLEESERHLTARLLGTL